MKIYFQAESFSKNKYKLKPPTYINTFSFQMYELACGEASATSMEKEKKTLEKVENKRLKRTTAYVILAIVVESDGKNFKFIHNFI